MDKLPLRLMLLPMLLAGGTHVAWAAPVGIAFRSSVEIYTPAPSPSSTFGGDVTLLGDLNGDGVGDLAAVRQTEGSGASTSSRVFILFMRADGSIASFVSHTLGKNGLPAGAFSDAVESIGDLDGDGVVDIAVGDATYGASGENYLWILLLNSNGSIKTYQKITRNPGGGMFAKSIAYLGDIDGDGNKEIAVGSPQGDYWWNTGTGKVWIFDLSPSGLVTAEAQIPGTPGFTVPLANGDTFGSAVEAIPDLDGNGTPELAVGAANDVVGTGPPTGSVWILYMNSDYSVDHQVQIGPGVGGITHAPQPYSVFGSSLAWLPNVGCGRQALVVGAPRAAHAVHFLMLNDAGTVDDDYVLTPADPSFPKAILNVGESFAEGLAAVGDRDGDGITDLAIGHPWYHGSVYLVELETLRVEPRRIDMGSVLIGQDKTLTFTITNNGCTTREGPITVSGSNYVLDGPTSMSLAPGESLVVPVRFAPTDVENPTAVVSTPGGNVTFTGVGFFPACQGRWNIATFNAANLDTIAVNHAMWCGVPGGTGPYFKFAPGYGNAWDERLYLSAPVPYLYVPTNVELTFVYNSDFFDGDAFRVLTYRMGSLVEVARITGSTKDANGQFTTPGAGLVQFTATPSDYIDLGGGRKGIAVVLNVLTDWEYSDEDFVDTKGAIQIDNVALKFNGQVMSSADFEPGGSDGGWCNGMTYPTPPDPGLNWSSIFAAPPAGKGLNGAGWTLTTYNGLLVVGGEFTQAGTVAAKRVAGWNGSDWQAFGSGLNDGGVFALTEHQGSLIAAGSFTGAGGVPTYHIARWNGTSWSAIGAGLPDNCPEVKSYNGLLYASRTDKLSIWNGVAWSTVTAPGWIYAMEEYHGDLWMAGGGSGGGFMTRWDGAAFKDTKTFNGGLDELHVHDDLLYVGGQYGIPPAPGAGENLSAWNGTNWVTPQPDYPQGIAGIATLNGRLVIGVGSGYVTSYVGMLNVPMPGSMSTVYDVATYQGDLYVVGAFQQVGSRPSRYIAKWSETLVGVRDPVPATKLRVESYPNPFNPAMTIRINHATKGILAVDIYDVAGRRVKRVVSDPSRAPGTVELQWDGTNDRGQRTTSGVYFLRVQSGRDVVTRKLVQIK